jgi:hypothetical protein
LKIAVTNRIFIGRISRFADIRARLRLVIVVFIFGFISSLFFVVRSCTSFLLLVCGGATV